MGSATRSASRSPPNPSSSASPSSGAHMADPAAFLDLLARAELRSAAGDWAEAAGLWARVTEANPVHGDYWARLAEARFAERDFAAAAPAYAKVLELGVRPGYQVRFQALLHHLIR